MQIHALASAQNSALLLTRRRLRRNFVIVPLKMAPMGIPDDRPQYPSELTVNPWLWASDCESETDTPTLGFWQLKLDRNKIDSNKKTKLDHMWNTINALVTHTMLYDACCMTGRSTEPGEILCFTRDFTNKEGVQRIADVILRVSDYEGSMFYFKSLARDLVGPTKDMKTEHDKEQLLYMFFANNLFIWEKKSWKPAFPDRGKWELFFDKSVYSLEKITDMKHSLGRLVNQDILTDVCLLDDSGQNQWVISCYTKNWWLKAEALMAADAIRNAICHPWPIFYKKQGIIDENKEKRNGSYLKKLPQWEIVYRHVVYRKEIWETLYMRQFFVKNKEGDWKVDFTGNIKCCESSRNVSDQ